MIAIIFDIDGTLVQSSGFDKDFARETVIDILGLMTIRPNLDYEHGTDSGILSQIMEDNNIKDPSALGKIRTQFGQRIQTYLEDGGQCDPVDGGLKLLRFLDINHDIKIGFATGGWGHTAKLKLKYAGYETVETPFASCDNSHKREEIMTTCLAQMGDDFETIVYVGDGEWDRTATHNLGWHFIGIGPDLESKCDHWLPDFSDLDSFFEMIPRFKQL